MKTIVLMLSLALIAPAYAAAQTSAGSGPARGSGSGSGSGKGSGSGTGVGVIDAEQAVAQATANAAKLAEGQQNGSRFVRTLTNVQIELTLSDQVGNETPEKKMVSMIVASGSWGKIRSSGAMRAMPEAPFPVDLNVDARPYVSIDGPIQLELTLVYSPPVAPSDSRTGPKPRPSGVNQSLTVVLQSGKSLVVSQAADPISDRKVIVEVKATVLK